MKTIWKGIKKIFDRMWNGKELPPEDLGRNDRCHCGSGKKYKHCCYDKDQKILVTEHNKECTNSG